MPRLSFASRLYSFVGNAVIGFPPDDPRLKHMYLLPGERVRENGPLHEDSVEWLQERIESPYLMRQMTKRVGRLVSFYLMGIMVLGIVLIVMIAPKTDNSIAGQQTESVPQLQNHPDAQDSVTAQKHALFCKQTLASNRAYPASAVPLPSFCGAAGATPASTIPQYINHE